MSYGEKQAKSKMHGTFLPQRQCARRLQQNSTFRSRLLIIVTLRPDYPPIGLSKSKSGNKCEKQIDTMSRDMTKQTKWCFAQQRLRSAWHTPSLLTVFTVRMKKALVLSYPLSAQRRLWSDWPDAQADLSLRLAHSHFVGFVMSRLI